MAEVFNYRITYIHINTYVVTIAQIQCQKKTRKSSLLMERKENYYFVVVVYKIHLLNSKLVYL